MHLDLSRWMPGRLLLVVMTGLALAACDETQVQSTDDLMQRAGELRDQGKLRASIIDLKTVLQKEPKHADARLMLGEISLDIGDAESAEKEFKSALELRPNDAEILFLIGKARLLRGDYQNLLKGYTVEDGSRAVVQSQRHQLRGEANLALFNLDAAEKDFRAANAAYVKDINEERPHLKVTEPPEYLEAVVGLTNVFLKKKEWDAAETQLKRAEALSTNDPFVLAAKGELAFKKEQFEDSESAFRAAFEDQPNQLQFQLGLGRAQIALEKFDEAIGNFEAVLKQYPDHILTNYYRSLAAARQQDFEGAKLYSDKILKLLPSYVQSHLIAGIANYGLNNFEQANVHLSRYLSAAPANARARRLHGLTQLRLARPEAALETLKPLADQEGSDSEIMSLIGTAAARSGELVLAKDYFSRAVELDPDNSDAKYRLAISKLRGGEVDEGLRDLEQSANDAPEFLKSQYTLLLLNLRLKNTTKRWPSRTS